MTDENLDKKEYFTSAMTSELPELPGEVGHSRGHFLQLLVDWKPPIWLEKVVIGVASPLLIWLVAFLLAGKEEGLPGGQIFALLVLVFLGIAAGFALELIKLPPLLGMLVVGIALRNLPHESLQLSKDITNPVSISLRQIALVVILTRAGLGLDPVALAKLSGVVLRLACGPCLMETLTLGICAHFILGFPWAWGFLLGFVIAAVSPAVTVPCLLSLRDRGYGVAKGIPTIIIAAASLNDIVSISLFGVTLGFAIAQQSSLTMALLHGPIEVVLGILFSVVWGTALGLLLSRSESEQGKEATLFRMIFVLCGGCLAVFGFQYVKYSGSGALGCLGAAFVASVLWRQKGVLANNDNLNWAFQKLWFVFQPLLFGLIGCQIDLVNLDANAVSFGILCLAIALVIRIITSYFIVAGAGFTLHERFFIALAGLPKATVQAAIGSQALDLARLTGAGPAAEKLGLEVLTIAVISILITAPAGAVAIMLSGPKLLSTENSAELDMKLNGNVTVEETKRLTSDHEKKVGESEETGKNRENYEVMIEMTGISASAKPT